MRSLLLIPSRIALDEPRYASSRPRPDYFALQDALGADILDYGAVSTAESRAVYRVARRLGLPVALAALGYMKRRHYDIIYANGENVAIPLALLLKRHSVRPIVATIGHRLSAPKKRVLLRVSHSEMDAIFVYASAQEQFALTDLHIPPARIHRIPFHVDQDFFRAGSCVTPAGTKRISSAGLEWRDYPTLIEAVDGVDVELTIAAASPWSRSRNALEGRSIPVNVRTGVYNYAELRQLYADSAAVIVPLYPTDFQAGITTILEGMSMAKPVISTRTAGQTDTIVDTETGFYVPASDPTALREAIREALASPEDAHRVGAAARDDVELQFTLNHWVGRVAGVMKQLHAGTSPA